MKLIVSTLSLLLLFTMSGIAQYNYYQAPENTEISKLIYQQEKTIVKNMWLVDEMKGEDKIVATFYAVNYYDYKSANDVKKGLKVIIENTSGPEEGSILTFTMLETYIDKDELTQIIIALDNMLKILQESETKDHDVSAMYQTKDGFFFGFMKEDKNEFGIAEIRFDKAAMKIKFKKIDKSLEQLKTIFDNVTNELYLLEDSKKKGKSSDSEEQIIDTDI